MKKRLVLTIFLLVILMTKSVFAATDVTMEIVEDNICKIQINDSSYFEKKIVKSDLTNHQVTLQLKITNNSEVIIPTGELMLVIDSSSSMDKIVSGTTTRKDLVLNSANKLVTDLLKANSTSLKIGVVTFSTGTTTNSDGYLVTGTAADAQKVCDLSNNLTTLTSNISAIEGTGSYTNLDAGLQLAKSCFSSANTNKYMIVLTDGLPNLAVGYNDLVSYSGLTNVINQTKSTLTSLNGIDIITMLTGIDNKEATFRTDGTNSYTYGQVINKVFGTEQNPTIGKFYNISDSEIESTITEKIYRDLLPISYSIKDITVVDYFPQYIVDNFEMTYVDGIDVSNVSAELDKDSNSITWNVANLGPGETAVIQYNLTLKDEFDEKIINQILDTNQKVDITYKDFDNSTKNKTSDVTPKIKLVAVPEPSPEEPKPEEPKPDEPLPEEPTPPVDTTITPEPLPDSGSPIFTVVFIMLIGLTIFFGYKYKKIN